MAKSDSRVRNWATIAAFTLIVASTIAEGIDEGFSFWDWLVMGIAAAAILQSASRLTRSGARA